MGDPKRIELTNQACHFCHKKSGSNLNMSIWYGAPYGVGAKWLACPNCKQELQEYRNTYSEKYAHTG